MDKRGDRHTQDRLTWLDRVARDRAVGAFAVRVAVILMGYINRDTGEAWPSQQTLALAAGASDRGVRKALDELQRAGLIEVVGRGLRTVNRYRMAGAGEEQPFLPLPCETGTTVPVGTEKGGTTVPVQPLRTGTAVPVPEPKTGTTVPPGQERLFLQNPLNEPSERESISPPTPSAFDDWWAVYPLKRGKEAARKAFAAVLKAKRATVAELTAGASAYAGERAGKDPRYTKHAATWLNAGCWSDEPLPDFTPEQMGRPHRRSELEHAMEILSHEPDRHS